MDDLARGRRRVLKGRRPSVAGAAVAIFFGCACAPVRGEPVGVSSGGPREHEAKLAASSGATLAALPPDFRASFHAVAKGVASEHGGLRADVYDRDDARVWAEDLFAGDAGVGVYVLEHGDAGVRFAVADAHGQVVADDARDAGPSLEACARCHAGARDAIFPVAP